MKRIIYKKHRKKQCESVKCQYCATHAKTSGEVNEKFGFKQNRERYKKCKNCMNNLRLGKEAYNETQNKNIIKNSMKTIKKR